MMRWRPVPEFPYEVSSTGRVRRAAGGSNNTYKGRKLKGYVDRDGYTVVRLSRQGAVYDRKVHRLVCEAFHGTSSSEKAETRHIDGIRSNNASANLAWGTTQDNADDRARHGNTKRGEHCRWAKLSQLEVDAIRARHRALRIGRQRVPRGTMPELAREYGVSRSCIATIVSGRGFD
jgi:hypothetical protein